MKIYVINGPNINMLGTREPEIYGKSGYTELTNMIEAYCSEKNVKAICYQSNHEGDLVDKIQEAYFDGADGIVINPAAYTHTSIALLDAIKAVSIPTVEVHISNVNEREDFRRVSYVKSACVKSIVGQGLKGYLQAIDYLIEEAK